jgi:hypothetical protein
MDRSLHKPRNLVVRNPTKGLTRTTRRKRRVCHKVPSYARGDFWWRLTRGGGAPWGVALRTGRDWVMTFNRKASGGIRNHRDVPPMRKPVSSMGLTGADAA